MPILASEALFRENKKIQLQNATLVSIEPLDLWFQVQHAPLYTNLAFACKTKTLSSLYSHALLILTKSSKSKHQVVHEQKFKNLLSSTCQVSVERSMLDLVQWFNTRWGNILLLDIFGFHMVKPLMPILALLSISFNYEKPRLTGLKWKNTNVLLDGDKFLFPSLIDHPSKTICFSEEIPIRRLGEPIGWFYRW